MEDRRGICRHSYICSGSVSYCLRRNGRRAVVDIPVFLVGLAEEKFLGEKGPVESTEER